MHKNYAIKCPKCAEISTEKDLTCSNCDKKSIEMNVDSRLYGLVCTNCNSSSNSFCPKCGAYFQRGIEDEQIRLRKKRAKNYLIVSLVVLAVGYLAFLV